MPDLEKPWESEDLQRHKDSSLASLCALICSLDENLRIDLNWEL